MNTQINLLFAMDTQRDLLPNNEEVTYRDWNNCYPGISVLTLKLFML